MANATMTLTVSDQAQPQYARHDGHTSAALTFSNLAVFLKTHPIFVR